MECFRRFLRNYSVQSGRFPRNRPIKEAIMELRFSKKCGVMRMKTHQARWTCVTELSVSSPDEFPALRSPGKMGYLSPR